MISLGQAVENRKDRQSVYYIKLEPRCIHRRRSCYTKVPDQSGGSRLGFGVNSRPILRGR